MIDLSHQEKRILALCAYGMQYQEMGSLLGIKLETVHTYVDNLTKKLALPRDQENPNSRKHQLISISYLTGCNTLFKNSEEKADQDIASKLTGSFPNAVSSNDKHIVLEYTASHYTGLENIASRGHVPKLDASIDQENPLYEMIKKHDTFPTKREAEILLNYSLGWKTTDIGNKRTVEKHLTNIKSKVMKDFGRLPSTSELVAMMYASGAIKTQFEPSMDSIPFHEAIPQALRNYFRGQHDIM